MKINIVCNFLCLPKYRKRFEIDEKAIYLSPDSAHGNIFFDPAALAQTLGRELDPISLDFCEIAAYVYLADKAIPRGEFDHWPRNLSFLVPVREPAKWDAVKGLLRNTIALLSGDSVQFHFVEKPRDRKALWGSPSAHNIPTNGGHSDSVALFSGGLDSFAGAVHLLREKRRPFFVSHYVNALLKKVQARLLYEVQAQSRISVEHLQYRLTSKRAKDGQFVFKTRESSHRTRSFLFMCFAGVTAALRNLEDIYICENGMLALNVPISEARKGSRSTRHAHPLYLQYFSELLTQLYEHEFNINNPFLFWTKGEEASLLKESGFGSLVKETVSCWGYPNQTILHKNSNHCGYCIPCIVRRVSLISSGLALFDDRYIRDVFSLPQEQKANYGKNLSDLIYFCQCIMSLSTNELIYKYPEFIMIETYKGDISGDKLTKILRVYKQFARDLLNAQHSLNTQL